MIPELGHVALIIAFGLAIGLTVVPFWGSMRANVSAMNLAPSLAVGILVFKARCCSSCCGESNFIP